MAEVLSTETPILFQSALVDLILQDVKTRTLRLTDLHVLNVSPDEWVYLGQWNGRHTFAHSESGESRELRCRYDRSRLWVRERHRYERREHARFVRYATNRDGLRRVTLSEPQEREFSATRDDLWRPSILMHRWASRLSVAPTRVCAMRLCSLSDRMIRDEGVSVAAFSDLWDRINPQYPYRSNPWVWNIKFKRS